jgi:uncharacterized repeat protein (TIGR01451 family)
MYNNILWHNRSFFWSIDNSVDPPGFGLFSTPNAYSPFVYRDLAVLGTPNAGHYENNWTDTPDKLNPVNSILTSTTGYAASNVSADPGFVGEYLNAARGQTIGLPEPKTTIGTAPAFDEGGNFIDVWFGPLTPTGNYHLQSGSPAVDAGMSFPPLTPITDFDGEARAGPIDIGADERVVIPVADLSITKSDGVSSVTIGGPVNYTIVVSNAGPNAITGAAMQDAVPAAVIGVTWTCTATAGSSCNGASGSGNTINRSGINLLNGGSVTFVVSGTIGASASTLPALNNTATVSALPGTDPNPANNTATDSDSIVVPPPPPLPAVTLRDDFNRANANTLGGNWSQATFPIIGIAIRVNANQGAAAFMGNAYWNVPAAGFGNKQGASFGIANATLNGDALILKATGATALGVAPNFIRVSYTGGTVVVATTTNYGLGTTSSTTINNANSTFVAGDTLTAVADATGTVNVWKNATFVGAVTLPNVALWTTGGGRVGMQLPAGARVDNFRGATVP